MSGSEAPSGTPSGRSGRRAAGHTDPELLASDEIRAHLASGTLTVRGQIRDASNAVLVGEVEHEGRAVPCVYKPVAGERPLWDFPDGTLAQREVAAYEISRASGWDLIPATVLRDGPYGEGMCQAWVGRVPEAVLTDGAAAEDGIGADEDDEDDEDDDRADGLGDGDAPAGADALAGEGGDGGDHDGGGADGEDADGDDGRPLLALIEGEEPGEGWRPVGFAEVEEGRTALLVHADDPRLRRLAVLDAVINNGDRKGGHLLPLPGGLLYAIDHGVTFNADDKLRTLLWGWAGEELTAESAERLRSLAAALADGAPLAARLAQLITGVELDALRKRIDALLSSGRHPLPSGDWPAIPWPPV